MDKQEQAAEQLFGETLELPRDQRRAFLDRVCAGKPALRRMVEDLLDENDRLSGFLSEPAFAKGHAAGLASQTLVLASGKRLLERYKITGKLGAGGMGVVSRARDEKLGREVAIKMLPPGVLAGDEARARFRREAQALAKMNHAHIASVYDVIEQDGADCIVMELVAGESLAAKLRGGALPVREATTIALQVAEALEEAHEQCVIHRDLKPANVMMSLKGQAKVLDFGLARLLGPADVTQTATEIGGVMGTPLYMSPEQAIGQKADVRSDLWSLGVTYYESLTGVEPFRRPTTMAILRAITDEPVQPMREFCPETPLLAEQIVARALEKDPELRYQHARDFATDLRRVLRDLEPGRVVGSGTRAEPVSGTTAGAGPIRHIALRRSAFLVAALVVAGTILMLLAPAPATGSLESTQISVSNEAKLGPLLTDGARLYFESHNVPSAMSVSGGVIAPIPGLSLGMYLVGVLADGSKVLVWAQNMINEAVGGWFLVGRRGEVLHSGMFSGWKVSDSHGARAAADGDLLRCDETVADTQAVRRAGRLLCLVSRQSRCLLLADPDPCGYVPSVGVGRQVGAPLGYSGYDRVQRGFCQCDGRRTASDYEPSRSGTGVLAAVEVSDGRSRQSGEVCFLSLRRHFLSKRFCIRRLARNLVQNLDI
jgi:predicted Ser/Thr protein kinase